MIVGQIVISKMGRDKGHAMIVMSVETDYVHVVDGKRRPIDKPKKKKTKHLQHTNSIVDLVPPCGRALQNSDIRKFLAVFGQHGSP